MLSSLSTVASALTSQIVINRTAHQKITADLMTWPCSDTHTTVRCEEDHDHLLSGSSSNRSNDEEETSNPVARIIDTGKSCGEGETTTSPMNSGTTTTPGTASKGEECILGNEMTSPSHPRVTSKLSMVISEGDEEEGTILVPPPGQSSSTTEDMDWRLVTNRCSVCLSCFDVDDTVVWSVNTECPHVFHAQCLHDWLATVSRKFIKRQILHESSRRIMYRGPPQEYMYRVPLSCPCCRRPYLQLDKTCDATKVASGTEVSTEADIEAGTV